MTLNQQQRDAEHNKILQEVVSKPSHRPRRHPATYLVGSILVILLIIWLVPTDLIPNRVHVKALPELSTITPMIKDIPERPQALNPYLYLTENDPTIKRIAATIVTSACATTDQHCYADALGYFVRNNIKYVTDPTSEYYELPHETLLAGAADCDGQAILLSSLMRAVGIQTRFGEQPGHLYVEAYLPKKNIFARSYVYAWHPYDPTCKSCTPGELTP